MEASAKTNTNVKELFFDLVRMINKWRDKNPLKGRSEKKSKNKKSCALL